MKDVILSFSLDLNLSKTFYVSLKNELKTGFSGKNSGKRWFEFLENSKDNFLEIPKNLFCRRGEKGS
jgi:hypothetical protein